MKQLINIDNDGQTSEAFYFLVTNWSELVVNMISDPYLYPYLFFCFFNE